MDQHAFPPLLEPGARLLRARRPPRGVREPERVRVAARRGAGRR